MKENNFKKTINKLMGIFNRKKSVDKDSSEDGHLTDGVLGEIKPSVDSTTIVEKSSTKKKVLKIVNICTNVILALVLIIVLLFAVMAISKQENDYNMLFGYTYLAVLTDSMSGDQKDSFDVNDLVIAKVIDGNKEEIDKLKEGDIITFFTLMKDASGGQSRALNTHRIIKIQDGAREGERAFRTKGDNSIAEDTLTVDEASIVAVYSGQVNGLGFIVSSLQDKDGFLYFILIPSCIAVIYCLYVFIANLVGFMKARTEMQFAQKGLIATAEIDQAEKERIKQELLKEMGIDPNVLNKSMHQITKTEVTNDVVETDTTSVSNNKGDDVSKTSSENDI
ncbi:MAG: hypothetical protein LBF68_07005 [Christensenellaceae bacterium]|jgi:signal peptidase I|nr:hypothetical protein [Christensenellaceae bacterium]